MAEEGKSNSGRGKSYQYPNGSRRKVGDKYLAPRSARKRGKYWMSDCTKADLQRAEIDE